MLDPPTAKQLRFLDELGVTVPPKTKGEASAMIDRALADQQDQGAGGSRSRVPAHGVWSGHDHRFPGAVEWLMCVDCGQGSVGRGEKFQGVEGLERCPECGSANTVGTGWVCCFEPVSYEDLEE
jgi:hypothetical protein